jgi:hypothetical protein
VTPSGVASVLGVVELDALAPFVAECFDELHAASKTKQETRTAADLRP